MGVLRKHREMHRGDVSKETKNETKRPNFPQKKWKMKWKARVKAFH